MMSQNALFGEPALRADRDEMKAFLNAVFGRCQGLPGWVTFRSFEHKGDGRAVDVRWAPFDGKLLDYAVEVASSIANRKGAEVAVFSPPVCLFGDAVNEHGARTASAANVVCGPVLAVELDARPMQSLGALEAVLGAATVVVASGGRWVPVEGGAFAEDEQKLHAYWRLREPAVSVEDRETLRVVRAMACRLVGADATAVSLAHPMRWPGSWHTKDPANPVLCRVVGGDARRDAELGWCRSVLEEAIVAAGMEPGGVGAGLRAQRGGFKTEHEWSASALMDAARMVPNNAEEWGNDSWGHWVRIGMAFYDASHGSTEGLEAYHAWSERGGAIYDPGVTDQKWSRFIASPPSEMSGGTLLREMRAVDPDYVLDRDLVGLWFEEPEGVDSPPVGQKIGENALENAGAFGGDSTEEKAVSHNPQKPAMQGLAGGESTSPFADDASAPVFVRELNRHHAFAMNRGQAVVVNFEETGDVSFSNAASFFARYANRQVKVGKREMGWGEAWFEHDKRRQYVGGVEFDPRGVRPGVLNLWRGLPPLAGDGSRGVEGCSLILRHMREIVCGGDARSFDYLMGWLAHMLQRPGEKPGVAVVLRGGKGTGKDTVGEYVREMIGSYYMHAASAGVLMGRFNGHLAARLMLHVEEVAWEGSKRAEGVLKSLVTAPVMSIESKGVNAVLMRSALRVLMTSNEDYVVPASADERRWFVLDVSSERMQDDAWFGPLRAEMEGDGPACLRRVLLEMDLSSFNVRAVPRTAALADQQAESLVGFDRFWAELLEEGTAFEGWGDGPVEVPRDTVRRAYEEWERRRSRGRGDARPDSPQQIGRKLVDFTGVPADRLSIRPRVDGKPGPRSYGLPSLDECRAKWLERFAG